MDIVVPKKERRRIVPTLIAGPDELGPNPNPIRQVDAKERDEILLKQTKYLGPALALKIQTGKAVEGDIKERVAYLNSIEGYDRWDVNTLLAETGVKVHLDVDPKIQSVIDRITQRENEIDKILKRDRMRQIEEGTYAEPSMMRHQLGPKRRKGRPVRIVSSKYNNLCASDKESKKRYKVEFTDAISTFLNAENLDEMVELPYGRIREIIEDLYECALSSEQIRYVKTITDRVRKNILNPKIIKPKVSRQKKSPSSRIVKPRRVSKSKSRSKTPSKSRTPKSRSRSNSSSERSRSRTKISSRRSDDMLSPPTYVHYKTCETYTLKQLRDYARYHGINLRGKTKKVDICTEIKVHKKRTKRLNN